MGEKFIIVDCDSGRLVKAASGVFFHTAKSTSRFTPVYPEAGSYVTIMGKSGKCAYLVVGVKE